MLSELRLLLSVMASDTSFEGYRHAIVDGNVLLKPSMSTRTKTFSYLRDRFALDLSVPLFSVLRLLWERDVPGQPLMTLLVAAFRDPLLRSTFPSMIECDLEQSISSKEFSQIIDDSAPGKFIGETLIAAGERLVSTYRKTGHIKRMNNGVRQRVSATPGSATMALLLASLEGASGRASLDTDWVRILDSPGEMILAEARVAASRGWLEYRHAGDVLEITFRQLLASSRVGS